MSCPKQRLGKHKQIRLLTSANSSDKLIRKNSSCQSLETSSDSSNYSSIKPSKQEVLDFLRHNTEILDEYVNNEVSKETIIQWMTSVAAGSGNNETEKDKGVAYSPKRRCFTGAATDKDLKELLLFAKSHNDKSSLLMELSRIIAKAIKADGFHVYIKTTNGKQLSTIDSDETNCVNIQEGDTIAGYVAVSCESILINSLNQIDSRFPNGMGSNVSISDVESLLVAPFLSYDNQVIGIVELIRFKDGSLSKFQEEEMETVQSYLALISITLKQAQYADNDRLNSALLEIFRILFFGNGIDMEAILKMISDQAVSLFQADRSSIFIVDKPRGELYAQVFGIPEKEMEYIERVKESTIEVITDGTAHCNIIKHSIDGIVYKGNPIRFPVTHGIAGHVARTGETVLSDNVTSDNRFNSQVDLTTGYITKSILCGPLTINGEIIGVIELINKRNGECFASNDKDLFTKYIEYCSKIYGTAKEFHTAKYSEQQYKVTIEMLAYHRQSNEMEVDEVKTAAPLPKEKETALLRLDMNTFQLNDTQHFQASFLMFSQLAHLSNLSKYFNSDVVLRFILTVSKNYRPIPYHGWYHGFWVAQNMYAVVSKEPDVFTDLERVALFVACLCHDLDHRGYTNNFFAQSNAPLAALYSTSIMENHHFNQTLAILQTPGVDLFSAFDTSSYRKILQLMEHAIISTDLALLWKNKAKFEEITSNTAFDWKNDSHKSIGLSILMIGCDVSATARPWDMHKVTVDWLMEEFHKQGDREKEIGLQPLQLMDKDHQHKLPTFQIGFMKGISLPCYLLLSTILPCFDVLVQGSKNNMESWMKLEESINSNNSDNDDGIKLEESINSNNSDNDDGIKLDESINSNNSDDDDS